MPKKRISSKFLKIRDSEITNTITLWFCRSITHGELTNEKIKEISESQYVLNILGLSLDDIESSSTSKIIKTVKVKEKET